MPSSNLSPRALCRQQLDSLQPAAEFDAFVIDSFSSVQQKFFCSGLNRVERTNILLQVKEPHEILDALGGWRSEDQSAASKTSRVEVSPTESARMREQAHLRERLAALRAQREIIAAAKGATQAIEQAILEVRRKLRQSPQLSEGDVLGDGRYLLLKPVGRGGFASVWIAHDRDLKVQVAVKVLHSQLSVEATPRERFQRGANRMATLSHPHIMKVLALPKEEDGFYYFITPFFEDGDLRNAVLDKRITRQQAIEVVLQAGEALHFAHQHALVHRDVKPANILLSADGQAQLGDFDLVWCADTTGGTRTGATGTYVYSAPETQHAGASDSVDPLADQYSLAMTLMFTLHGQEIDLSVIIEKGLTHFIRQINCSNSLQRTLRRALSRERYLRYPSVEDFCQAVQEALASSRSIIKQRALMPEIFLHIRQYFLIIALFSLTILIISNWRTASRLLRHNHEDVPTVPLPQPTSIAAELQNQNTFLPSNIGAPFPAPRSTVGDPNLGLTGPPSSPPSPSPIFNFGAEKYSLTKAKALKAELAVKAGVPGVLKKKTIIKKLSVEGIIKDIKAESVSYDGYVASSFSHVPSLRDSPDPLDSPKHVHMGIGVSYLAPRIVTLHGREATEPNIGLLRINSDDMSKVENFFKNENLKNEIESCYEQKLDKDRRPHGKVTMQIIIDKNGSILQNQIVESTFGGLEVGSCMWDVIKRRRFPALSRVLTISHTFEFDPP